MIELVRDIEDPAVLMVLFVCFIALATAGQVALAAWIRKLTGGR